MGSENPAIGETWRPFAAPARMGTVAEGWACCLTFFISASAQDRSSGIRTF